MALPLVGAEGAVVGADISPEMLTSARARLYGSPFLPVAADGQELPFRNASFDAVVCQLAQLAQPITPSRAGGLKGNRQRRL
jgi:ubiquinone/menaquinone biosynthesis C-methylase UbiE